MSGSVESLEKPIPRTFWKKVRSYFREYCNCTTIHGFRYFGEKRTIFERIWWFVVFLACVIACSVSIYEVYKKWERSPVIVTFATKGHPIYNIPFPAITICPETKFDPKALNLTELYNNRTNLDPKMKKRFWLASLLCDYRSQIDSLGIHNSSAEEILDLLHNVSSQFRPWKCEFMGQNISCNNFKPLITDEGKCYTFNFLDRSEIFRKNVIHYRDYHVMGIYSVRWSLENGYLKDAGYDAYPRRAFMSGVKNALNVNFLVQQKGVEHICKKALPGFKVLLHTPLRFPSPSQEYFRLPLNQAVIAAITPKEISTSDSVKMYNPRRRECFFQYEKQLKFFKIYSSLNCKMECLTNRTLQLCECVDYFMPREKGTKICGIEKSRCMDCAKKAQYLELIKKIENSSDVGKNECSPYPVRYEDCGCFPICSDLSYNVELSQSNWEWYDEFAAKGILFNKTTNHMSSLTIYFKEDHFIPSIRNELYGPTDFLANFGGLLGLFTGFSVLSLMEILYFLTIRIFCNRRLYGYWGGKDP